MIGSPIVFQTAPPQPESNALATCTYVFVGGPLASQNGFGLLMPAKFTLRSAINVSFVQDLEAALVELSVSQEFVDSASRLNAVGRGVDDLRAAAGAIAADENFGVVAHHAAAVETQTERLGDLLARRLAQRAENYVAFDHVRAAGDFLEGALA